MSLKPGTPRGDTVGSVRLVLVACAVVLATGIAVGASAPSSRSASITVGDGCLVVQAGFGTVYLNVSRGVVFGRFASGRLSIDDVVEGDSSAYKVSGAERKTVLGDHKVRYEGDLLRFRATGALKIAVNAQLIDLSVVGRGTAVLSSAGFDVPTSLFSVDSRSFCEDGLQLFPAKPTRFTIASADEA